MVVTMRRHTAIGCIREGCSRNVSNDFSDSFATYVTLDDDLYGTRSKGNQVKPLSIHKAEKEGHSVNVICDALFRITLRVRFRRHDKHQTNNVKKTLREYLDGKEERYLHGLIATADSGYGSMEPLKSFLVLVLAPSLSCPSTATAVIHLLKTPS